MTEDARAHPLVVVARPSDGDTRASPTQLPEKCEPGHAAIPSVLVLEMHDPANAEDPYRNLDPYLHLTAHLRDLTDETNWSNGEVVQRGTGANYGKDGFLRPGMPYSELVQYLHAKLIEARETGHRGELLSRDWKIKLAAALVPQGLEFDDDFLAALSEMLDKAVRSTLPSHSDLPAHEEPYTPDARLLLATLRQVIDYAKAGRKDNERISSQLEKQPKSVDSFVDQIAVEAQDITNGLTNSAVLAAAVVALQFAWMGGTLLLSVISPFVAIATVTNTSRYKNRNEDWRVMFTDERYVHVLKDVYAYLSKRDRLAMSEANNPYACILKAQRDALFEDIKYYGYARPSKLDAAFADLLQNIHDPGMIRDFRALLAREFVADVFSVNSYLQEEMTVILSTCEELLHAETSPGAESTEVAQEALVLFERLLCLRDRLEASLQRGYIVRGYHKQRKWKHSHLATLFMYFWAKVWITKTSEPALPKTVAAVRTATRWHIKPFVSEAKEVYQQMHYLSEKGQSPALHRAALDMRTLYYASTESYTSTFVILVGWITFWTFVLFAFGSLAGLFHNDWPRAILMIASGVSAFNQPLGAALSAVQLTRKIDKIARCAWSVSIKKAQTQEREARKVLAHVSAIAAFVAVITFLRLVGSLLAAVSIPWNFAAMPPRQDLDLDTPRLVALGAILIHVISLALRFVAEYATFWHLNPKLGEHVCGAFADEIMELHKRYSTRPNSTVPLQVHHQVTSEYVARSFTHVYRFDAVFRADRFGAIYQYLQTAEAVPGSAAAAPCHERCNAAM